MLDSIFLHMLGDILSRTFYSIRGIPHRNTIIAQIEAFQYHLIHPQKHIRPYVKNLND